MDIFIQVIGIDGFGSSRLYFIEWKITAAKKTIETVQAIEKKIDAINAG